MSVISNFRIVVAAALGLWLCACSDTPQESPARMDENGVVVGQAPLWIVPNDPLGIDVETSLCPMPVIGDQVIVPTHRDGKPGFRRMKIETGEIVWEWYMESAKGSGLGMLVERRDFFVTSDSKQMVFRSLQDSLHVAIDLEKGQMLWCIERCGTLHYDGGEHYYCGGKMNCNAYKVNIADGSIAATYRCRAAEDKDGCDVCPFSYQGKQYLFVVEYKWGGANPELSKFATNHFGVVAIDSSWAIWGDYDIHKTTMLIDNQKNIDLDIHQYNDVVYVFNLVDFYCKFDMVQGKMFNHKNEAIGVRYSGVADNHCHTFCDGKMLIGNLEEKELYMRDDSKHANDGAVVDLATGEWMKIPYHRPTVVMDDAAFFAYGHKLYAVDINTGKILVNINVPGCYRAQATASAYKNAKGERYVILSSTTATYCYQELYP